MKKMTELSRHFYLLLLIVAGSTCWLSSCNKLENGELGDGTTGTVEFTLNAATFEAVEELGNRAATPYLTDVVEGSSVQQNTIELGNGFLMVAELTPVDPQATQTGNQSLKDASRAALDTTNLSANIRYRVLVYNSAGAYVTERDYIRGQEASTQALQLDGGSTYSFIVYSINSTAADLPAVTPAATASRTLANSQISVGGTQDYMYFRQNLTVTGNSINRLNIVLKHRFSQITTTINASQTRYNITAVSSNFQPHNTNSLVNLSDGSFTRNGTATTSAVTYPTLGGQVVNAVPTMINAPANQTTIFTIPSITIGPLTQNNLTPFTTLRVTPGVRYNLILNIVPTDEYLTHSGRPAARINGRIWALHNVGVDPNTSANPDPITSVFHGNFYQFGRNVIVAAPTATAVNGNWSNSTSAAAVPRNSWNSGSEAAPARTVSDPCPTGYRVPTRTEIQQLLANVIVTNRGPFEAGSGNYNSGKVLTSVRRADVVLVLPAQGFYNIVGTNPITPGALENRGAVGHYWTSSASGNNLWRLIFNSTSETISELQDNVNYVAQSRYVRCTATL
ncbi:hypothetical protein M8998_04185 [Sphingobacterium sp. lm-10]|uniref:hypothetical protein n=1 Tax=Sphingobacterium sp. lm-10 TaxID=2944904 RepID=UPI0020224C8E|nr:hypothetical protein [Sphingobacterium sp. lm-10]MCL7987138.1 hypothetical protein [Sphingobacterium sp. lm-10]